MQKCQQQAELHIVTPTTTRAMYGGEVYFNRRGRVLTWIATTTCRVQAAEKPLRSYRTSLAHQLTPAYQQA